MSNAVQHIAFNCTDIGKQEAFYRKHLGFKRVRTFNRGKPDEFMMLRLGSCCIELFQTGQENRAKRAVELPVGFVHLAFEVTNIEDAVRLLQADGVRTEQIIDCSDSVPGLRICFFHDPDGNRIELMQGWKDEQS